MVVPVLKWVRYGSLILVVAVLGFVGRHALFQDIPKDQVGGPFSLAGAEGRTVTDRDFRGLWTLVFFGYTHCPDVCPTGCKRLVMLCRNYLLLALINCNPSLSA